MKIKVLASGSKGNATVVFTDSTCILIDIGISYLSLQEKLDSVRIKVEDIGYVLITHTHSDHVKGLKAFLKKTGLKALVPFSMNDEILKVVPEDMVEYISDEEKFGDIEVSLIHTSHDTSSSVGYIMKSNDTSLVYVTDTGYLNNRYLKMIKNFDIYIIESNHDEVMLMEGGYPFILKQRILSDSGHLSNKTTAKYLSTIVGEKTKYVVLAHLSEKNNTEELAYSATKERLENCEFSGEILIASQDLGSELLEV